MKSFLGIIFFFLMSSLASAQETEITIVEDSLYKLPNDTNKVKALLATSKQYYGVDKAVGIRIAEEAINVSKQIGYHLGVRNSLNKIGNHHLYMGEYSEALSNFIECLKLDEEYGRRIKEADDYVNIGIVHYYQNKSDKRIEENWLKSEKIYAELDDQESLQSIYNNLGGHYSGVKDQSKAEFYLLKSLELGKTNNDGKGISGTLVNLGTLYTNPDLENKKELSQQDLLQCQKAERYYLEALPLVEKHRPLTLSALYLNLAELYNILKDFDQARRYANLAIENSKKNNNKEDIVTSYKNLSSINRRQGRYHEALAAMDTAIITKESLQNENTTKAIEEMEAKYQTEKKEQENELLKKDNEVTKAENERRKTLNFAFGGGIIALMLLSILIFNQFRQKKKANALLSEQKLVIEDQNEELNQMVEEISSQRDKIETQRADLQQKNEHVAASINYAKRIQDAIMPSMDDMNQALQNGFVYYLPKDVVAGDFFWLETVGKDIFFAAADCTGHGVPGAMVSVVCSNALTKSLLEERITNTGKLLDRTREIVIEKLARSGEEVKDGMDISLCKLNLSTKKLQWSGANNPIWILRKEAEELEVIKADKQPIGIYRKPEPFTAHDIQLNHGDTIYIFTDGFQDQFGGPEAKKYMAGKLKKLLVDNHTKTMVEQKQELEKEFTRWKGNHDQIDDVCIIGVKV